MKRLLIFELDGVVYRGRDRGRHGTHDAAEARDPVRVDEPRLTQATFVLIGDAMQPSSRDWMRSRWRSANLLPAAALTL